MTWDFWIVDKSPGMMFWLHVSKALCREFGVIFPCHPVEMISVMTNFVWSQYLSSHRTVQQPFKTEMPIKKKHHIFFPWWYCFYMCLHHSDTIHIFSCLLTLSIVSHIYEVNTYNSNNGKSAHICAPFHVWLRNQRDLGWAVHSYW